MKDEQFSCDGGQTQEDDPIRQPLLSSIVRGIKMRQVRKKVVSSPFTMGERKKQCIVEPNEEATLVAVIGVEVFYFPLQYFDIITSFSCMFIQVKTKNIFVTDQPKSDVKTIEHLKDKVSLNSLELCNVFLN